MEPGRFSMEPRGWTAMGDSGGRAADTATPAPRAKRKKARPNTAPTGTNSQSASLRPIPQPYLALAPKPISSYSRSRLDEQQPISSNLVLPSSFRRPTSTNAQATSSGDAGPSTTRNARERERERERFANGLLAPPAIRAGGTSRNRTRPVSPGGNVTPAAGANTNPTRRRQGDRAAAVRGLGAGNPSMTSLGHLGRILEADPTLNTVTEERAANPPTMRRRRRIVRGEDSPGVERRLTVSSREEGRAIGLARGASMRRLNVWDDLPENNDAPPPFPFPTTSTSRLPPTFQSTEPPADTPTVPIPNSPPPTFEQAIGLHPLPLPLPSAELTTLPPIDEIPRPSSSASTRYMSAPSSPVLTALESADDTDEVTQDERSDRRMWNADLLAGYSLVERVERELSRKTAREGGVESLELDLPSPVLEERDEPNTQPGRVESPTETIPTPAPAVPLENVSLPVQTESGPVTSEGDATQSATSATEAGKTIDQPNERTLEATEQAATPSTAKKTKGKGKKAVASTSSPPPVPNSSSSPIPASPARKSSDLRPKPEETMPVSEQDARDSSATTSPKAEAQATPKLETIDATPTPKGTGKKRSRKNRRKSSVSAIPATEATEPATPTQTTAPTTDDAVKKPAAKERESVTSHSTPASTDPTTQEAQAAVAVPVASPTVPAKLASPISNTTASPAPSAQVGESPRPGSIREISVRSLPTLSEGIESPTPSTRDPTPTPPNQIPDAVFGNPAPTRKLTRGKAIRRSSSGLIKTSESPTASAPLFSAARFDFGKPSTETETHSRSPLSSPPLQSPRTFVHRSSAPEIQRVEPPPLGAPVQERQTRKSEDRGSGSSTATGFRLIGGRRLGDAPVSSLDRSNDQGAKKAEKEEMIPPHREAALLRRESILAQRSRPGSMPSSASAPAPVDAPRANRAPAPAPTRGPAPITIPARKPLSKPISPRADEKSPSVPSGPLIDLSDFHDAGLAAPYQPSTSEGSSHGFMSLATANAELLQLLEEEAGEPQSSSQAAAKAALVNDIKAQLSPPTHGGTSPDSGPTIDTQSRVGVRAPDLPPRPTPPQVVPRTQSQRTGLGRRGEDEGDSRSLLQETIKKEPPPPPPPLRNRKDWTAGQKISIVDTATSPITPRPSIRRPPAPPQVPPKDLGSPGMTTKKAPPPLPTRRPPPPPPGPHSPGSSQDATQTQNQTPPPLFTRKSEGNRPLSSTSAGSSVSSMFDQQSHSTIAPLPLPIRKPQTETPGGWKRFDRSPHRPRGPRPPPAPPRPRTWAKVASVSTPDGHRPPNDRTHSTGSLGINTQSHSYRDETSSGSVRSPRSSSERDLTRAARGGRAARSPEYTDLDVFVSRLEGSGREYEGYSQIAQFLGPAKSPAASREALQTLLPGPILLESRRLTKEGKTKLKLSLLGVRVTKCPICLAQFREGEMGVIIPTCGHLGHQECVGRWFREDDRCFVCRDRLKVEEGVV